MFTTGSKLLIGSAAVAWISAAVYGIAQEGALGTIGLISVAVALTLLAGLDTFVRDANIWSTEDESYERSPAAQASARPSIWPLVVAIGATAITLGLATVPALFVIGLVIVAAGTVEWVFSCWSERASADSSYNKQARDAMSDPLALPVAGAVIFAVVVYAFSRVMLGMPSKASTVVIFGIVAALALGLGTILALQRGASGSTVTAVLSLTAVALVGTGTILGFAGEREIPVHETTADLAAHDECGPEHTHADDRASQTVAAKSNVMAELVFDGAGLAVEAAGYDDSFDTLTLARRNPNHILFRNDGSSDARLVIDLHPAVDTDGEPLGPERVCTTLVEPGGVQFLTVDFDRPSFAIEDEGNEYVFTVPGSDAAVGVVVP